MNKLHTRNSVAFGASSYTRALRDLTDKLKLVPTLEHQLGEEFSTRTGIHTRFQHAWQIRSEKDVKSDNLDEHILWVLQNIEPFQEVLQEYIHDPGVEVIIRINCICADSMGGFSMTSDTMKRLAAISNRLDFCFIGEVYSED